MSRWGAPWTAPHRDIFLFIYIHIFLWSLLMAGPSCFFVFFDRPGTVLGCTALFIFKSTTHGEEAGGVT